MSSRPTQFESKKESELQAFSWDLNDDHLAREEPQEDGPQKREEKSYNSTTLREKWTLGLPQPLFNYTYLDNQKDDDHWPREEPQEDGPQKREKEWRGDAED